MGQSEAGVDSVQLAEFKAQVLAEHQQPGASVAAIALAHGLNVNLLRKCVAAKRNLTRRGQNSVGGNTPCEPSDMKMTAPNWKSAHTDPCVTTIRR
jgi:transposase-like protein